MLWSHNKSHDMPTPCPLNPHMCTVASRGLTLLLGARLLHGAEALVMAVRLASVEVVARGAAAWAGKARANRLEHDAGSTMRFSRPSGEANSHPTKQRYSAKRARFRAFARPAPVKSHRRSRVAISVIVCPAPSHLSASGCAGAALPDPATASKDSRITGC